MTNLSNTIYYPSDADVRYLRSKLIDGLQSTAPASELLLMFKQLIALEDALVIYHEHRPPENT